MFRGFLRAFFLCFLLLTVLFAGAVAVVDPYYRYHPPVAGLPLRLVDGRYQNPGVARNFPYDSLLLGTSVTANFDPAVLDRALGCRTQKLIVLGGFFSDFDACLEAAFGSRTIDRVFWGLDSNILLRSEDEKTDQLPDYLYHTSPLGDLSYLLNKEMFFWDVSDVLALKRQGRSADQRGGFTWGEDIVWSRSEALANYPRPEVSQDQQPADGFLENARSNWEVVLKYVQAHPETQFTLYMAPYSILYWDMTIRNGDLDAVLTAQQWILEQAAAQPNVEMFYFMDDWPVMSDLDNYCDYIHYSPEICLRLEETMAAGEGITAEEIPGRMADFRAALLAWDYEQYFPAGQNNETNP